MNTAQDMTRQQTLAQLLCTDIDLSPELDVLVTGLQLDSRQIKPGDLFIACFGSNHDARDFIDEAIALGAVAVLAEAGGAWSGISKRQGLPIIAVENLSVKKGEIAARFHQHPSKHLNVIGVTGTNGKTSCSQYIAQALTNLGDCCGVTGTIGHGLMGGHGLMAGHGLMGGHDLMGGHGLMAAHGILADHDLMRQQVGALKTTPDALTLQSLMDEMLVQGAATVAMEVSSHGLQQHRVDGVNFDVALFTNLTRDHLDYHGEMNAYGEAKRQLFLSPGLQAAVVNIDDTFAPSLLNSISSGVTCYTYSVNNQTADVYSEGLQLTAKGFNAVVHTPWGAKSISSTLLGTFNVSNFLAALTSILALKAVLLKDSEQLDLDAILQACAAVTPVSGRMEIIGQSEELTAVVDYAHTPDALLNVLKALRQHFQAKIWCVFGCGGNRDRGKRPIMAEVAEQYADYLIVTDDNPRIESAEEIIKQILLGVKDKSVVTVRPNRAAAIDYAIVKANVGDVVLVAGKGHETYQDVAGTKLPFSDVKQVRLALQKRTAHKR